VEKSGDGEEAEVKVVEAEKVEDEPEDKAEAEEKEEAEPKKEKTQKKPEKEPPVPKSKKSGLSMAGLIITVLGAIGIAGAVLLDPIMNLMDSSHPAEISIGNMQMIGIVAAAVVLIVGIIITVITRKKPSSG
jgi:uncharacterized membrane protein YdbT with pleckstrin-like domain